MRKLLNRIRSVSLTKDDFISLSKWMLLQAKPFRKQLFVMLCINIFSLLMSFGSTIVGKYIVDATTTGILNARYVLFMAGATLFSILFSAGMRIFGDYVNEKFSFGMRCDMFDRVQRSVWQEVSKFHSGDIVTRLTSDVSSVSSGLISILPSILVTFLQLLIAFGILFYFDKPLALFALVIGPVGAVSAVFFRKKYSIYQTKLRESESEYRSFMQENMANLNVVKVFQCEDDNNAYMQSIRAERMKTVLQSARLGAVMSSVMRIIYSAGYVVAFCWSAYRLSRGVITYGTMTVFLSLVSQVQGTITSLGQIVPQLYSMLISAKRITEVIDIRDEDYRKTEPDDIPQEISVYMQDVTFAYDGQNILENVDLHINNGEIVGIVGTSGVGKTTLIRLLLSLVQPQKGIISYINGSGSAESAQPASRRFISYVPQGNTLLSGTIEKNLRTGRKDATEEEMWAALRMADAEDFVRKCPDGLQTVLSERAGGISEGQAQRISIARALLRNKPLLILDEATSALDENTESRILSTISASCGKTCLIITHRRSMLQYCDRVIEIFDDGRVEIREQ